MRVEFAIISAIGLLIPSGCQHAGRYPQSYQARAAVDVPAGTHLSSVAASSYADAGTATSGPTVLAPVPMVPAAEE